MLQLNKNNLIFFKTNVLINYISNVMTGDDSNGVVYRTKRFLGIYFLTKVFF